MSEQPGRQQRSSFAGMIGALLVLLVGVGAFVVLRDVNRVAPEGAVQPVDYATPARLAQRLARFELLAPPRLPDGWVATSVRFDDDPEEQSWHLGLLTDEQRYIGVEQAERTVAAMVEEHVGEEATEASAVEVAGERWSRWTAAGRDPDADPSEPGEEDMALTREVDGAAVLVLGRASQDQLTDVAASLR